jgi:uncharacterized damage-inducible protein DinB
MLADRLPHFEHDHRASMEMMRAVAGGGKPPEEAVRLMAHVAATKSIYLDRMRGEAVGRTIFPPWGMEEICASLATVQTGWLDYLRALTPELRHSPNEFESLSRGGRFQVSRRVTCVQVVLPGQYHRGQVARVLRECGLQPPSTDMLFAPQTDIVRVG